MDRILAEVFSVLHYPVVGCRSPVGNLPVTQLEKILGALDQFGFQLLNIVGCAPYPVVSSAMVVSPASAAIPLRIELEALQPALCSDG